VSESVIYADDYLKIFIMPDGVYIESFKKGFPVDQLSGILSSHPEIGVTSINVIKNSINSAPKQPEKFGVLKDRIVIEIFNNDLAAAVTYNLSKEELEPRNREKLIRETLAKLSEAGVVFGINKELFSGEIICGKQYPIAEGIPPIHGTDSIIKMYEMEEAKPTVHEGGKVDFYDLKLINRVKIGDWLGERIEATEGMPGTSVKGESIKPVKGRNFPLNYDKNSVQEIYYSTNTVLYSRINGAVNYSNGKVSVSNHLEIDGDVDLSTGNIKFDGYLTIKGTVFDGFSVEATKDIEINGDLGLGNVKEIVSTGGSIYIKGGISSKSRALVMAAKNVFIKFVDNADITCGGMAHIGYYCINSMINANNVILDSSNGQIMGGHIKAKVGISAPIIGTEMEKKTVIEVTGFDRKSMVGLLDSTLQKINTLKNEQQKLKQILAYFEEQGQLNPVQRKEYNSTIEKMFNNKEEIKNLEEERKNISNYLKARGDGEISVSKKIYPNCTLILKDIVIDIPTTIMSPTYYIQDGDIKQI